MSSRSSEWPAPRETVEAARRLVSAPTARGGRVIVAPHGDVDGLCAAVLVIRALERMGGRPIVCLPEKGSHVHAPAMRERLASFEADGLIVLDMGSRRGPIVRGVPTVVIDHHDARERPDDVIDVSSAGCEPVAPTGLLAYELLRELAPLDDVSWLARLATVGDLGMSNPFADELAPIVILGTSKASSRTGILGRPAGACRRAELEHLLRALGLSRSGVRCRRASIAGASSRREERVYFRTGRREGRRERSPATAAPRVQLE